MVLFHLGRQISLEGEVSSLCCLCSHIYDLGQPRIIVPFPPSQSSRLKALDSEGLPTNSHVPCAQPPCMSAGRGAAVHPNSHSPPCLTWSAQSAAACVGANSILDPARATARLLNNALLT